MTSEDAKTLASLDGPHANSLVSLVASREDVSAIRVPGDLIDAGVVANHDTDR